MKLVRYRAAGQVSWGAIVGDDVRPLDGPFDQWAPRITAGGAAAAPLSAQSVPLSQVQLLSPVAPGARLFAIGVNYASHTPMASAAARRDTTLCFTVPMESVIGPDEEIRYPAITDMLDYEVELVGVLGTPLVAGEPATRSVLGYTIGCDTSARDTGMLPNAPIDFYSMKGLDATKPLGPWIVTRDEFGDQQPDLMQTTRINGEVRQHESTTGMTWGVQRCLQWIDKRSALHAGDQVWFGTPGGVALEDEMRQPGTGGFLNPGDELEFEITGIGVLRSRVGPKGPNHEGFPWFQIPAMAVGPGSGQ
jgi:2-keto-4-pentenoate hydratase/2-oxohepta-3-ene-1,7-dioic acid hydratase in catechol pathway